MSIMQIDQTHSSPHTTLPTTLFPTNSLSQLYNESHVLVTSNGCQGMPVKAESRVD